MRRTTTTPPRISRGSMDAQPAAWPTVTRVVSEHNPRTTTYADGTPNPWAHKA